MAAARFYSSTSGAIDLTADIAASDTGITVSTTSGLPGTTPFTLVLDPGQSTEEIVTVTNVSGLTLTVTRGVDGSAAQAHSAGAGNVRHMATARDFREPQEHIGASAAVHGVAGSVVGTTDVQTLTNKTLTAPALTGAAVTGSLTANPGAADKVAVDVSVPAGISPTVPAVQVACLKALGSSDYVKIGPGLTNAFEYGQGDYSLTLAAAFTVGKSGQVTITGSQGLSEPTTPTLTVRGSRGGALGTTASGLLSLKKYDGTEVAAVDKDGAITSPTITSLQSADTALDSRVGAIETNLGSQATFAAASTTKDGKRVHWGTASCDTDPSGFSTVTHGAGFTPTVVIPQLGRATGALYTDIAIDSITATTFRARFSGADGSIAVGAIAVPLMFFCGE